MTITAKVLNSRGKEIDEQRLEYVRSVILGPFPTWEFVIFLNEQGKCLEMFKR